VGLAYAFSSGLGGVISATSDEWIMTVPSASLPTDNKLYWTISAIDGEGRTYTSKKTTETVIPAEGHTFTDNFTMTLRSVTVEPGINGGALFVSKPAAAEGETVTITAQPNYKYVFAGAPLVSGTTASGAGSTYSFTMPSGTGDVTVSVNTTTSVYNNRFLCTDASLDDITFNNGLFVNFRPSVTNGYTITADYGIASITVTPTKTVYPSYKTITVNGGVPITSGTGKAVGLTPGNNPVTVVVTPESGSAVTYTITARRRPAAPSISGFDFPATGQIAPVWGAADGAATYELYRSENAAEPGDSTMPTQFGISETTVTHEELINGTRYHFWVRGITSSGTGSVAGHWSPVRSTQPGITTYEELRALTDGESKTIGWREPLKCVIDTPSHTILSG
jgi:hypothetical protein